MKPEAAHHMETMPTTTQRRAFQEGYNARVAGHDIVVCPHRSPQGGARRAWKAGYNAAPAPAKTLPCEMSGLDGYVCRRIASDMILKAIEDMTAPRPHVRPGTTDANRRTRLTEWRRKKLNALIWMCSKKSTIWIENMGYDQDQVLLQLRWPDHARWVIRQLRDPGKPDHAEWNKLVCPETRAFLRRGIEILER
jgi:ribosome modulation factor